ncbi:MAG: hypothetical protein KDE00_10605 [Rhodobacteraceae bacterium]|nr:hypothetical protein [Paracoccaceae bacterium]
MTQDKAPRRVTPIGWTALGLAGAAMSAAVAAEAGSPAPFPAAPAEKIWLAQSTEGGEGGESGHVADGDETVELLADLGLIEGHLRAGTALYRAGLADQAATHMKHPQDEIYEELGGHLEEVGAKGFAEELTSLAGAVAEKAPVETVEAALANVLTAIAAAREAAGATESAEARAMVAILRTAADEYGIGVKDGAIAELHEYQDAWGFVETVRTQAEHMAGEEDAAEKAFGSAALAALDEAAEALPGVDPAGKTLGDPAALLAAVAKVELAAYKLR